MAQIEAAEDVAIHRAPLVSAELTSSPPIRVVTEAISATEWDQFAARCDASFRASYWGSRALQFEHHVRFRMYNLGCYIEHDGVPLKFAQAAVGVGRRIRVFADDLHLLPEYRHMWQQAMMAVLAHLGPGIYQYGGNWSLEPPRGHELASLNGVALLERRPITVHFVDFSQWKSWDSYISSVSSNAKRNAKRAEKEIPSLSIAERTGASTLHDLPGLLPLRKAVFERKGMHARSFRFLCRFMLRATLLHRYAFTAVVRRDGKPIANFGGVWFGHNTYYLESGSGEDNLGVTWFLLLRMLRNAYERAPSGRFFLGAYYDSSGITDDAGLRFFRDQCRAVSHPTAEYVFSYS